MTDMSEFERKAEACIRMAESAKNPKDRAQLLTMAQAWRRLITASQRIQALADKAK